jgi:hypothetical protein
VPLVDAGRFDMTHRHFVSSLIVLTVLAVSASIASGQAAVSTAKAPAAAAANLKTSWGDPDLQGVWTNHHGVPLERPGNLAEKTELTNQDVEALETAAAANRDRKVPGQVGAYNSFWLESGDRSFSKQTSLVVDPPDGKLPLRPDVKAVIDARVAAKRSPTYVSASWEDRDTYERCLTRGMPGAMIPGFYNHNYQILQTPGYVVIYVEMIHDARIIPLDGRPRLSPRIGQWMGDSRGHWEGKTLVVETTNFNGKVQISQHLAFGLAPGGRLVERFTRTGADLIDYRFTVDDQATFTKPFTVVSPMQRLPDKIYEYACHEGNIAMHSILSGARAQESETSVKK